jgi:glycosyltransferase involved in cell wall biosynthesis
MGGAVTYLTNVLRRLPPPESGYEFVVYLPAQTAQKQKGLDSNIQLIPIASGRGAWWKSIWWQQVTLRRLLKLHKADVMYSTRNFAMWHSPVRQILLVANALYFSKAYHRGALTRHSGRFQVAFRLRRWLICQSARRADVVVAPTQATLDDLRQFVEVGPEKTLVNPYGAFPAALPCPEGRKALSVPGCPGDSTVRLVYVSLYSEHKNLSTLLKAMPLLNRDGARKFRLLTTVNPGWPGAAWTVTHQEDLALARRPDVAPWVEFVGPSTNGEAQQLYREGDIFVFPSVCESFGLPMVEAMAHGLPIVAADTPVNREICGEAALYFRPLDPEDLAEKVILLGRNQALREKLGTMGQGRAATCFRWEDHVERLLQAAGNAPLPQHQSRAA